MKKLLASALVLLILVSVFVGCGNSTTYTTSDTSSVSENSSPAASTIGKTDTLVPEEDLVPISNDKKIGYQLDMPEKGEEIAILTIKGGGEIKLRFFPDEAPKTVYNFKIHALNGYYDGITFHRIIQGFMIQGGDPVGNGTGGESVWGGKFVDEFNENLVNINGSVAMANAGPATNGSQFFINNTETGFTSFDYYQQGFELYKESPDDFMAQYGTYWIDFDKAGSDYQKLYEEHGGNPNLDGYYSIVQRGHTVFAQVFEGMEEVSRLSAVPTAGDTPTVDVIIEKVEIVVYEG